MIQLATSDLVRFLATYGDFAVLLFVAIESTRIASQEMTPVGAFSASSTEKLTSGMLNSWLELTVKRCAGKTGRSVSQKRHLRDPTVPVTHAGVIVPVSESHGSEC